MPSATLERSTDRMAMPRISLISLFAQESRKDAQHRKARRVTAVLFFNFGSRPASESGTRRDRFSRPVGADIQEDTAGGIVNQVWGSPRSMVVRRKAARRCGRLERTSGRGLFLLGGAGSGVDVIRRFRNALGGVSCVMVGQ